MRLLCVTDEAPWPSRTGYRLRLAHVLRGLTEAGTVDLVAVVGDGEHHVAPVETGIESVEILALPPGRRSVGGYARWACSAAPRTIATRSWGPVRARIRAIAEKTHPDVVWWSHADVYSRTHDLVSAPAVVDLDNLEDWKARERRRVRRADRVKAGRLPGAAEFVRWAFDHEDERRWRRLQRRIAAAAAAVVVCSELDRARLGVEDAIVVPNGYDAPSSIPPRRPARATFTMIALFTYEPNIDAATFLTQRVLPRVRAVRPDAEVRLVGRHDGALDALAGPGVVVTGEVPDVTTELGRADAVVVPLRFGGGTRLKVLEAFAYRVPVVSTTLGAEGLEVRDGVELMLADDEETFAERCLTILDDPDHALRLADAAHRLWAGRFSGARMVERVAELVRTVGSSSSAGGGAAR